MFFAVDVIKDNKNISVTNKDCTYSTFLAISTLVMVWIEFFVPLLLFVLLRDQSP